MTRWHSGAKLVAALLLVSLAACAVSAVAQGAGAPFLAINGQTVADMANPPLLIQGTLMVSLDSLLFLVGGQQTITDAQTGIITVTRGNVTLTLTLGQRVFKVGYDDATFDWPPMNIDGIAYVDAQAIAKALGGQYSWNRQTLTGNITIRLLGLGGDAKRGSLVQLYPGNPSFFIVKLEGADTVSAFVGADNIQYFQLGADGTLQSANASVIHVGDQIEFTVDANGRISRILCARLQVSGTVDTVAGGRILLTDGQLFTLAPNVPVSTSDGKAVSVDFLRRGDKVILSVSPGDRTVQSIVLDLGGTGTATTNEPRITALAPDTPGPWKAGGQVRVRMRGTPGGQASFDIGDVIRGIPLTENAAGDYRGTYTVRAGDNLTAAPLTGHLRVGGVDAPPLVSDQRLTLDTTDPLIVRVAPDQGERTEEASPTIQVLYSDPNGSGVDRAKVTLRLDGADVTAKATIDNAALTYKATNLALGDHRLDITVADLAGNSVSRRVVFTVVPGASKIVALTHDATGPLTIGDVLTITMEVQEFGRRAWVALGTSGKAVELKPVAGTKTYRGTYTVVKGDQMLGAKLVGHFVDALGREFLLEAPTPVDISTAVPDKLVILAPKDGDKFDSSKITVRGQAPPNRKLRVMARYNFIGERNASSEVVTSDDNGRWATKSLDVRGDFFSAFVNDFTIVVQLLDAADKVVQTEQVNISLAEPEKK
jgi:hypothetical protein